MIPSNFIWGHRRASGASFKGILLAGVSTGAAAHLGPRGRSVSHHVWRPLVGGHTSGEVGGVPTGGPRGGGGDRAGLGVAVRGSQVKGKSGLQGASRQEVGYF